MNSNDDYKDTLKLLIIFIGTIVFYIIFIGFIQKECHNMFGLKRTFIEDCFQEYNNEFISDYIDDLNYVTSKIDLCLNMKQETCTSKIIKESKVYYSVFYTCMIIIILSIIKMIKITINNF